jgi:hypothetical protein
MRGVVGTFAKYPKAKVGKSDIKHCCYADDFIYFFAAERS